MRNKMEKLTKKLNTNVMYFTENPINIDDFYGYRYFLVWQNTHNIFKAFKTQYECIEYLQELVEEKIIWIDGIGFKIVKEDD